ncbi:MAG: 5-oxoprolinase subunit PxpB [Paracoccaceae bacterium]|nr:5-oxoprolinase subunit PxpB [Paracoccaceae bacterium]
MTGPRFLTVGDCALSVEFGDTVDPTTNARVLALDKALGTDLPEGVIELVPTYRALMIHFDPLTTSLAALRKTVEQMVVKTGADDALGRLWRVPVGYGGDLGIDLADLAARHGLTEEQVVEIHANATYRVYMIGFAPGFCYLGGLPEALHTPRRIEPRLVTPAGTVSIGGAQAAVTSVPVPSGWHLIGRTPLKTFDPDGDPVFLFHPGDQVRFERISAGDWHTLSGRVERGEFRPTPEDDA